MSRLCLFVVLGLFCIQIDAFMLERLAERAPCKSCRRYCPTGFVLGPDGCPDGCQCCPENMCFMYCKHGFEQENGCDVCRCAKCPKVMCAMYCENGFVKDEDGCDKCECA